MPRPIGKITFRKGLFAFISVQAGFIVASMPRDETAVRESSSLGASKFSPAAGNDAQAGISRFGMSNLTLPSRANSAIVLTRGSGSGCWGYSSPNDLIARDR